MPRFAVGAVVQPLRALAWRQTLGPGVGFRAIYASSAIGSFLDTVLPGRLGEAAKVGVLRAASANRWPGLPRAGGSLLAAHLTEAIAFCLVGATAGVFLPVPGWVRGALIGAVALAGGGIAVAAALHHRSVAGCRPGPTASSPPPALPVRCSCGRWRSSSPRGQCAGSASR